jgi:hypothetical protein
MLGFLEPVCRQVCSQSYYNWLGQYFWPELLKGYSLVEFFTELDTTGIIATGTVLLASVGGLYYCISHRNGKVHIEESTTPPSQTSTINIEQAQQLLLEQQKLEREQPQRLQEAQLALEAETVATRRNANRRDPVGIQEPERTVALPRQGMPKQQILAAYFKTHLSVKMKYMNPMYTAEVEHDALVDMGLPLDGMIPTEPKQLQHYRNTLKGLGLNLNY